VLIHLNRLVEFDMRALKIPKLRLATLWILASVSPDQSRWALFGDLLSKDLGVFELDYPTTA